MSAHTAGPWLVEADADKSGRLCVIDTAAFFIATMHRWPGFAITDAATPEANARLIAAAPDMLAELHNAALSFADLSRALRVFGRPLMADACDIAETAMRAAIHRATGGTA